MEYQELTKKIIGCAYTVYNSIGFGFLESVYEKCLLIELEGAGLSANSQHPVSVKYNDQVVGEFIADIIVENKVILELKSVIKLAKAHEVQLVNYLTATGIDTGLLINFSPQQVEVRRKVRKLNNPIL